MLVLSRYREDTTFVDLYLRDVPHVVYQGGNPAAAHPVIPDAGLEALAYLRYICDNYANLPERIAFIHAHRYSRHYDDIVPLLQYLRWDAFPFFNLNVRFMVQRFIRADIERAEAEWKAQSSGAKGASVLEDQAWQKKNHVLAQGAFIMDFWRRFITPYSGVPFPDVVSSPCCASFVVSRERILKHPLKLYQTIADWLVSMELPSHWSARVLEYTWHVLWSDGPVEKQKHICQITDGLCSVDAKGRPKAPLIVSPTAVDMPPSLESVDDAKEWKRLWKEDRHKRGWRAP
ncbi:hypothetical protein DFJ74DRAFT_668957 [Hyaloraphidium curvatum]|nr:hypothetical protein DFJ74DRAFT_668957 [Hyaloraphidium curvatum]